ncbi:MAG: TerB family tellurite resistance protein [Spirochaetales bacterium]|nr:TerB family tellurite resistance protein [Spirochaetales bacterium]
MSDIEKLNHDEKVFLAGCIKTMVLADGNISPSELTDIDQLSGREGFDDFDSCLNEFEETLSSNEDFREYAQKITSSASREIILKHLDEISLRDGLPAPAEKKFFDKLKELWKV